MTLQLRALLVTLCFLVSGCQNGLSPEQVAAAEQDAESGKVRVKRADLELSQLNTNIQGLIKNIEEAQAEAKKSASTAAKLAVQADGLRASIKKTTLQANLAKRKANAAKNERVRMEASIAYAEASFAAFSKGAERDLKSVQRDNVRAFYKMGLHEGGNGDPCNPEYIRESPEDDAARAYVEGWQSGWHIYMTGLNRELQRTRDR